MDKTMHIRHGRRQAGNAMLELVLLLPVYVLLLYIVVTFGEYGQVATEVYNASRLISWSQSGADDFPYAKTKRSKIKTVFFEHFGPRVTVSSSEWTPVPLGYDGKKETGVPMARNGVMVVRGANDFTFGSNANPLPISCSYYLSQLEADEARPNLTGLAEIAMNGDDATAAASGEGVPWLRRQYAAVEVKYNPIGGFVDSGTFRIWHTVLRFQTWNTEDHAPYQALGTHPLTLRDVDAYPVPDGEVGRPGDDLHQMDLLNKQDFEPDDPED
ncbi:MAG: pilus assembly protein [Planctomycetes bacterium]|nr:pilus assembly protein [Planctomycetota bacterium]